MKRSLAILTAVRPVGISSLLLLLALGLVSGQPADEPKFAERPPEHSPLVDEDEDFARPEQTYAFNPVQATKELKVGNYYFKKGSYAAAATRYLEATRLGQQFRRCVLASGDDPRKAQETHARPSPRTRVTWRSNRRARRCARHSVDFREWSSPSRISR